MRAIWKGSITFGLVNIPIKIYAATEQREIEFHNLCPDCNTPLKYKRWCPTCEREVGWAELKKGYKITKGKWIVLDKSEIAKVRIPSMKTVDIIQFIDLPQIDPIYFQKTYYVVPEEIGVKAYSLFVEALRVTNKAAIGKVVLKNKEFIVCLRPYRKGLAMHILYYVGEIRDIEQLEELKHLVVVSEEELKLAQALIQGLARKELKLEEFKDRYTEALKELIKARAAGEVYEVKPEKVAVEAKELMEALKASVERVKKKKVEVK
jgi:DNA end-binding protein Ku